MCHRRLVTRVAGFDDALILARTVHRHFGLSEAVVVFNCAGGVVDVYALPPVIAGAPRMAAIGCAIAGIRPSCLALCLISSRPRGATAVLSETDVDLWHGLHDACATRRIHLADWLIADGHHVRSMAVSCSSEVDWSLRPFHDDG